MSYQNHDNNELPGLDGWRGYVFAAVLAACVVAAAALFVFARPAAADAPACQAYGITDDGGYIDCAGVVGVVRVTGVHNGGWYVQYALEVNDADAYSLRVHTAPDGSATGIVFRDALGDILAAANVQAHNHAMVAATIARSDGITFAIDCANVWAYCR